MELERTYQRTTRKRRKARRRIAAIAEKPHVVRPQGVYDDKDDIATVSRTRRNVARSHLVFRGIERTRPKGVHRVALHVTGALQRTKGETDRLAHGTGRISRNSVNFDRECHCARGYYASQ